MRTIAFTLETGDRNHGTAYLPERFDGRLPVVIYCHGWGGSQGLGGSVLAVRDALLGESAALVAFDFHGCGATSELMSQMTYGRWTSNLADIVAWVSRREWADPERIGCFGVSSGTTPALRLAQEPGGPAFVVSVATCLSLMVNMPNGPGKMLVDRWDDLLAGGTADFFSRPFGLEFFRDFVGRAPVYGLRQTRCPVFLLQGGADNPWRRSDAWLGKLVLERAGLPVKYLEIEDGDHGLDNVADRCAAEVVTWLGEIGMLRGERP